MEDDELAREGHQNSDARRSSSGGSSLSLSLSPPSSFSTSSAPREGGLSPKNDDDRVETTGKSARGVRTVATGDDHGDSRQAKSFSRRNGGVKVPWEKLLDGSRVLELLYRLQVLCVPCELTWEGERYSWQSVGLDTKQNRLGTV